jgi:ferritin-like metal-binding protein YciE
MQHSKAGFPNLLSPSEVLKNNNSGLFKLFEHELHQLLWVEQKTFSCFESLNFLIQSVELKACLKKHIFITGIHINRMSHIFSHIKKRPVAKRSYMMDGLIRDLEKISELENGAGKDAGLIIYIQKIAHFQIASYGSLRSFAAVLGFKEIMDVLQITLEDEIKFDEQLTFLAESSINDEAHNFINAENSAIAYS